jgi:outer membrane biosynthesis protein TonB
VIRRMNTGMRGAGVAAALLTLPCAPAWAQDILNVYVPTVDYPRDLHPDGTKHRFTLRYELDRTGHVAACAVVHGSGLPELDAESCHILTTRARLRPQPDQMRGQLNFVWRGRDDPAGAASARGEPLAYDLARRISDGDFPPSAIGQSGTSAYAVTVSPTGMPMRCVITQSSGTEALDRKTCEIIMTRSVYVPATDGTGPAFGIAHGRIRWISP